MFHDLTKEQKRALRAAAEMARLRDRSMDAEDAEVFYLDVRNASLPIVVGGAVARGIIDIDEVGEAARELVADLAERLRAVHDELSSKPPRAEEDDYDPQAAVSVAAVVDEIDAIRNDSSLCVNRRSGQIYILDRDELDLDLEDDEESEDAAIARQLEDKASDWVLLLNRFDVDDFDSMRRFARNARPAASRDLEDALHGKGAYRRFREVVSRRGLQEEWHRFRDEKRADLVKSALREAGIRFRK